MSDRKIHIENLGVIDYKYAWDYQEELLAKNVAVKIANRKETEKDKLQETSSTLLLCQHPHVYTLGKSGESQNLLIDNEELIAKKAAFYKINRGGDITYHGPGQLVVYPILDLEHFFTDIHKYLRYLEEVVIQVCRDYGLDAGRVDGLTGVWIAPFSTNPRKICAMGVKTSRWVTMHGLALNISPDLSYFSNIIPCGINDKEVTSLSKELGFEIPFEEVTSRVLDKFQSVFDCEYV